MLIDLKISFTWTTKAKTCLKSEITTNYSWLIMCTAFANISYSHDV